MWKLSLILDLGFDIARIENADQKYKYRSKVKGFECEASVLQINGYWTYLYLTKISIAGIACALKNHIAKS